MPAILIIVVLVAIGSVTAFLILPNEDLASDSEPEARVEELATDDNDDVIATEIEGEVSEETVAESDSDPNTPVAASTYADGTYENSSTYQVPSGNDEPIKVTVTLEGDIVTAVDAEFEGVVGTSRLRQARFKEAYQAEIVGKDIDELNLARVGGSSLTTEAFNKALEDIKNQAS